MKVAIIGGNAQSTPTLFAYLRTINDLPPLDFVLLGRTSNTLKTVARAGEILLKNKDVSINAVEMTPDSLPVAFEGADIVILQARIGGYAGRDFDETFPHKYGICGDEGLGPGGLSAAWRSWPVIQQILKQIDDLAPNSLLILLTSPIGILTTACTQSSSWVQVAGICELPWVTLNQACSSLDVDVDEVSFNYLGVNHLGWFHNLKFHHRDLVIEYAHSRQQHNAFPSGDVISKYHGIPMKYLELHFEARRVLKRQTEQASRGAALHALSEEAFSVFREGSCEEILTVLNKRPAPWYPYALGPLLLAWAGVQITIPFFLSVQNRGYCDRLDADDILEIPHQVVEKGIKPIKCSESAPENIEALVGAFVAFERRASLAVMERDISGLHEALRIHPWVTDQSKVPYMVKDIVEWPEQQGSGQA